MEYNENNDKLEIPYYKLSDLDKSNDDVLESLSDSTSYYISEISKYPLLSIEEEKIYAKKAKNGDLEAKRIFFESNLRLVVFTVRKYFPSEISNRLDLIQEGNIALMRAIDNYDYTTNVRFSNYAISVIKHSVLNAIAIKGRSISFPPGLFDSINKYKNAHAVLKNQLGREATINEIAEAMNVSVDRVNYIKNCIFDICSYNQVVNNDGKDDSGTAELLEFIPDNNSLEELFYQLDFKNEIHTILENSGLTKREKQVLLLRYGFVNNKIYTLREIGEMFHITREGVRQIEIKSIKKILSSENINSLVEYSLNPDNAREKIKKVKNKKKV